MHRRLILYAVFAFLWPGALAAQEAAPLYVATYLEVRPTVAGQGAELASRYLSLTRAEPGNLRAEALQEIGRENRFVLVEAWRDQASLTAHDAAAHTAQFRDSLKALHRIPYDQRVHRGFAIDAMPAQAGGDAVYVVTHVDVPGPRREEAEALLRRLHQPSLQDAGRVRYDVYQQIEPRTNHFTVFAAWGSRGAFDAYGGTAHWLQFREALGPLLGALYDERLYRAIR